MVTEPNISMYFLWISCVIVESCSIKLLFKNRSHLFKKDEPPIIKTVLKAHPLALFSENRETYFMSFGFFILIVLWSLMRSSLAIIGTILIEGLLITVWKLLLKRYKPKK